MKRQKPKVYRSANGVSRIIRGNYSGGSTRSKEWAETRERIRLRDGDKCCKCGRSRLVLNKLGLQLQTNHIRMLARGGTDRDLNLQCECEECHAKNFKHDHIRKRKKTKQNLERKKKMRYHDLSRGNK